MLTTFRFSSGAHALHYENVNAHRTGTGIQHSDHAVLAFLKQQVCRQAVLSKDRN